MKLGILACLAALSITSSSGCRTIDTSQVAGNSEKPKQLGPIDWQKLSKLHPGCPAKTGLISDEPSDCSRFPTNYDNFFDEVNKLQEPGADSRAAFCINSRHNI